MHGGIASVPGGRLIALDEKIWDTPTIIRVAGVEQATLLQWRRKYGFLGGAEPGRGRVGYRHSILDVCLTCTVVEMIGHGVEPRDACSDHPFLQAYLEGLITGELQSNLLGFQPGGFRPEDRLSFYHLGPEQTLGEVLGRTTKGLLTLVDLGRIISRVFAALDLKIPKKSVISGPERLEKVSPKQDRTAKAAKPRIKPKSSRPRRAKISFQKDQEKTGRR